MAKLTKNEVAFVAKLSKLNLSDKETEKFLPQLSSVIDYVSRLGEVDTQGIFPTSQTTGLTNVTRDDIQKPQGCLTPDEAVSGTDKIKNNLFVVPGVLEERTDK